MLGRHSLTVSNGKARLDYEILKEYLGRIGVKNVPRAEMSTFNEFCSIFAPDEQSEQLSTIKGLCDEVEDLQFSYYSFVPWVDTPNDPVIKTTYAQDWQQLYLEKKYHLIDPIVSDGIWQCRPFNWAELMTGEKEVDNFFSEAEDFGIGRSGYSVTACSANNRRGIFSINSRMNERDWQLLLREYSQNIICFALNYHHILCTRKAAEIPTLSNRERQVLYWSAHGKTVWEIGCILDLSPATIGFYVRRICAKLGRDQQVARGGFGNRTTLGRSFRS